MNKLPAMLFYVGDWRKDPGVQALSYEERGIWLELLLLMHESPRRGFLYLHTEPMTDEIIGSILGIYRKKWKKIKENLKNTGVVSIEEKTGCLYNRRMVRDEEIRQIRRDVGKLGGNPSFEKGRPNPYYDKQTDKQIDKQTDKQKITLSSSGAASPFAYEAKGEAGGENGLRPSSRPPASDVLTVKKLAAMYDAMKPDECPPSKALTESRTKKYAGYLKQFSKESYWEVVFDQMNHSRFLRGLESYDDRPPVARDLDWLCQKGEKDRIENCQKTYEGKYRDKPQGQLPLNGEWYPSDPNHPLAKDPE